MGGLARFDGLNFRTNFPGDPPALHSSITNIGHDGAGQLWVGTASGLLREDRGSFHLVTFPDPGSPHVEHMALSHDGGVWVDTGQHLWKLNADEKTLQRIDYGEKRIRSMVEDADGTLWLVDDDAVIAVRRTGVRDRFPLPNAGVVAAGADGNTRRSLMQVALSGIRILFYSTSLIPAEADPISNARQVLGLSLVFTQTQLKEAYRAKVRRWHPDSLQHQADADAMQAHKQMVQINAAYTYLSALQETK